MNDQPIKDEGTERREHILYVVTHAAENSEMALLAFMHAVGALAMEIDATIVLFSNGAWLAKKDYGPCVYFPEKPSLEELRNNFHALGGKLEVCTPCAKARNIKQEDMVQGADFIAAARYTDLALKADRVLFY